MASREQDISDCKNSLEGHFPRKGHIVLIKEPVNSTFNGSELQGYFWFDTYDTFNDTFYVSKKKPHKKAKMSEMTWNLKMDTNNIKVYLPLRLLTRPDLIVYKQDEIDLIKKNRRRKMKKVYSHEEGLKIRSKIWNAKMFYIRLIDLGMWDRWTPYESKIVFQFYELVENRKSIHLERKVYTGFTADEAYTKFIRQHKHLIKDD